MTPANRMTKAEYDAAVRARWDEATFQRRLVAEALRHGWKVQHSRPITDKRGRTRTAITGHAGYPDLTLARYGRLIIAELKTETGSVTPAQREWLEHLTGKRWPVLGPNAVDEATAGTGILDRFALAPGSQRNRLIALWRPHHWPTITAELTSER